MGDCGDGFVGGNLLNGWEELAFQECVCACNLSIVHVFPSHKFSSQWWLHTHCHCHVPPRLSIRWDTISFHFISWTLIFLYINYATSPFPECDTLHFLCGLPGLRLLVNLMTQIMSGNKNYFHEYDVVISPIRIIRVCSYDTICHGILESLWLLHHFALFQGWCLGCLPLFDDNGGDPTLFIHEDQVILFSCVYFGMRYFSCVKNVRKSGKRLEYARCMKKIIVVLPRMEYIL